jgi:DNA-binding response OmpR family regulator
VVDVARTGAEASRSPDRSADAILLDLRLPDGNGCDFVERLVPAGSRRVPVIAVSAHALAADHARALDVGCAAFIEKPIHVASFVDRIEQIAAQARPTVDAGP